VQGGGGGRGRYQEMEMGGREVDGKDRMMGACTLIYLARSLH
jgi:hypothetical protein